MVRDTNKNTNEGSKDGPPIQGKDAPNTRSPISVLDVVDSIQTANTNVEPRH